MYSTVVAQCQHICRWKIRRIFLEIPDIIVKNVYTLFFGKYHRNSHKNLDQMVVLVRSPDKVTT